MVGPNLAKYGMESLESQAAVLNALCEPDPTATPFYDIMCDALIWSDERNPSLTSDIIIALRQIWHFRTLCILKNERTDNAVVAQCMMLFPNWIGFLPERWIPTPEALAEYRRGDVALRLCLYYIDIDDKEENK
jgi:hypothetical protein